MSSWVCYRLSGTGPVVYSKVSSAEDLFKLRTAAKQWIFE